MTTVEGRLAATAYALVQEGISSGGYPALPKNPEFARIGAEAAALYELLNPGTILQTGVDGDPAKQRALQDFIEAAGDAFARGDLRLQDGELAQGWVEVFPELTEDERRLGELPGFTPARIEQWLETYPIGELGLPNNTGSPIPGDPTDNIISTPIPEETGPNIVEARPGNTKTPDGNSILPHGGKGNGQEYIGLKGHDVEQIDDIIANPRPELSGFIASRGRRNQPFDRFGREGDGARIFLEYDPCEGEVATDILAQGLRAGGGIELVRFLGLGMRDQLVEELPADEGMHVRHAFAQQIILNGAQHLPHLALHIGARGAEQEIHGDLRETELGEVVVEGGTRPIFDDAAKRVHLHVFPRLGVFAAHQLKLAVHHLDQRIGPIKDAQRGLSLNVARQDHIVMRDPRQGKAAHRPALAGADGGGATEGDRRQQVQHPLVLLDDH